jgi:hypothetical protein
MKRTLTQIKNLQLKRQKLEDAIVTRLRALRKTCKHPIVWEADYIPHDYGNSMPPIRMCEACRIEEEGWHCGYQILKDNPKRIIKQVERETLYGHRIDECCCRVGNSLAGRDLDWREVCAGNVVEEF